ncbi:hypothetical protein C8N33_102479 [Pararhodobacter aggregans]|nr:hypothetical protein C8N33_102479 [Pararhodobacter aggregans]
MRDLAEELLPEAAGGGRRSGCGGARREQDQKRADLCLSQGSHPS